MMGSVFDPASGRFLTAGDVNAPNVQKHIRAGKIFVEGVRGGGPDYKKLEAGKVVPDLDRIKAREDRQEARESRRGKRRRAKKALKDIETWDADAVAAAMPHIVYLLTE